MATLIQMFCPDCDYATEILRFGPTWKDQRNLGPAFDSETLQVIEADYDNIGNTQIIPYTNKHLQKQTDKTELDDLLMNYNYTLRKKHNFCPCCNGYSLNIDVFGMAD